MGMLELLEHHAVRQPMLERSSPAHQCPGQELLLTACHSVEAAGYSSVDEQTAAEVAYFRCPDVSTRSSCYPLSHFAVRLTRRRCRQSLFLPIAGVAALRHSVH
mmetsp:Transcript_51512/g.85438  ORF Transcript_51512/g.85438 Transcript_51512/m.85438 type:complete len:104 (+) Transcript_51512:586-897(+)